MATNWDKTGSTWILNLEEQSKILDTGGTYVTNDIQIAVKNGNLDIFLFGGAISSTISDTITNPKDILTSSTTPYALTLTPLASRDAITAESADYVAGWLGSEPSTQTKSNITNQAGNTKTIYIKAGTSGSVGGAAVTAAIGTPTSTTSGIIGDSSSSYVISVPTTWTRSDTTLSGFQVGYVEAGATKLNGVSNQAGTTGSIYLTPATLSNSFTSGGEVGYDVINHIGILEPTKINGINLGSTAFNLNELGSGNSGRITAAMDNNNKFSLTGNTSANVIFGGASAQSKAASLVVSNTTSVTVEGAQVVSNGTLNTQDITGITFVNNAATITGPLASPISIGTGWQAAAKTITVSLDESTLSAKNATLSGLLATGSTVTLDIAAVVQKNQAGYVDANDATFNYSAIDTGIPVYAGGFRVS